MTGVTVAAQDQMMRRGGQRLKPIDLAREFGRPDCLVGADRDAEAGRPPARERGGQTGGFAEKGNGGDRAVSVGEREAARAQFPASNRRSSRTSRRNGPVPLATTGSCPAGVAPTPSRRIRPVADPPGRYPPRTHSRSSRHSIPAM